MTKEVFEKAQDITNQIYNLEVAFSNIEKYFGRDYYTYTVVGLEPLRLKHSNELKAAYNEELVRLRKELLAL